MIHHIKNFGDAENLVDDFRSKPLVLMVPGILTSEGPEEDMSRTLDTLPEGVVGAIIHNETHGFLSDVLECAVGKLTGAILARNKSTCPEYPARVLRWLVERWGGPILILAHSQGAILTHNALRGLRLGTTIHVRTFGGAAWGEPDCNTSRHWVLSNDPVGNFLGRGYRKGTRKIPCRGLVGHAFSLYREKAEWEIRDWSQFWMNPEW